MNVAFIYTVFVQMCLFFPTLPLIWAQELWQNIFFFEIQEAGLLKLNLKKCMSSAPTLEQ